MIYVFSLVSLLFFFFFPKKRLSGPFDLKFSLPSDKMIYQMTAIAEKTEVLFGHWKILQKNEALPHLFKFKARKI